MDKKKLLLVAASVGMFLVIVMGAAILVFTPRSREGAGIRGEKAAAETAFRPSRTQTGQARPADRQTPVAPGYVEPLSGYPLVGVYPEGTPLNNAAPPFPPDIGDSRPVINVPSPLAQSNALDAGFYAERAVPPPPVVKKAPAPSAVKANYWVQTGSYMQKKYADTTKDYLSTKGISSIVLNSTVGGKIYYRVRVGPYVSQNEANYWLSLIKSIEGMENSQVWKSGT